MVTRLELAVRPELIDPRGAETADQIRSFLQLDVDAVHTREVYRIDAALTEPERRRILQEFVDPTVQIGALGRLEANGFDVAIHVGYKPGVTDPVGKSARVAIEDTLGRALQPGEAIYTSRIYLIRGVDGDQAKRIAQELLANPLIQSIVVRDREDYLRSAPSADVPKIDGGDEVPTVATIELAGDDGTLTEISRQRELYLSLAEMQAIRDHFRATGGDPDRRAAGLGDAPTDVELECLAQTWSEHCSHKIFNATLRYVEDGGTPLTVRSLFKTFVRAPTERIAQGQTWTQLDGEAPPVDWLVSVFHDNAGAVRFDDAIHLVYKVETHNSPSALDPYGGAITGIVGVNRDPFGTGLGSELLANVWGYCFADPRRTEALPEGLLHPRRIRDGVHAGVIDGGNQSGVPYGRGWELFDDRFLGKPLVFCGTVGSMPVQVAGQRGEDKQANPGDLIVMTGGRIGADGIHGATFSSAALGDSAPATAVQIGDPITQRCMFDFLVEARDAGLYGAITDNGAGGLSSSVGEMAEGPGGARLDLAKAPLKYAGLAPWEILVSEAQERMTLAVPPDRIDTFLDLARRRNVEATVLGEFTDNGLFEVLHGDRVVARLEMAFLHDGAPDLNLRARWRRPVFEEPRTLDPGEPLEQTLLGMLRRLNLSSNESTARHYDHEVKGLSVVKPFVGRGRDIPAEATVHMARHGSTRGYVLSEGVNPFYSDIDTFAMAQAVVDLALRRQLCAGGRLDRIALLDNFCWPDPVLSADTPDGEYKLAQLVRACQGMAEAVEHFAAPLISGKDSMKNDSTRGGIKISVPPTLLISAIGQIDDVREALTLDPKSPGEQIYLLGRTRYELGGSEYLRYLGARQGRRPAPGQAAPYVGNFVPRVDLDENFGLYRALHSAIRSGLVRSLGTPAMGGWGFSLAKAAMAGRLGLELDLQSAPSLQAMGLHAFLFSESCGRFLVTVAPDRAEAFEASVSGFPLVRIGRVTDTATLVLRDGNDVRLQLPVDELCAAFKETLGHA